MSDTRSASAASTTCPASRSSTIYLDNAATSWPKPPTVAEAMRRFLDEVGANPGRAGHRQAVEAARVVFRARQAVATVLGAPDPLRVVFAANATQALNLALRGLLRPGSHVVTTGMEHNAVIRPLRAAGHARRHRLRHARCPAAAADGLVPDPGDGARGGRPPSRR